MEIEYLYEFTVIARLESFSRAAEELCISQSSLSKHILALERELGVPLLQRSSRNVTLSPAGAQIFPMAQKITELNNTIHTTAAAQAERERTVLSIGSIPVMAQYGIPGLLAGFQREIPEVTLEVSECERQELLKLLENGKCELAFLRRGLEEDDEIEYLELCRDCLVAVVSADHPLAGRAEITLPGIKEQIADKGWVGVSDCACGAGATLIAAVNTAMSMKINFQTSMLIVAQDIDYVVASMCYLQLSLLGCAGYVVVDNSITNPSTSYDKRGLIPVDNGNVWYMPMYFTGVWHWRRVWAGIDRIMDAAMPAAIPAPAEEAPPIEEPPAIEPEPLIPEYAETEAGQRTFF